MAPSLMIYFSQTKDFPECDYLLKSVIRQAISKTLLHERVDYPVELSVTLCDNSYIKELNSKYRNKDKPTDVLSFPMYDFYEGDEPEVFGDESVMLGDIVVSLERTREQAAELGAGFLSELAFLCIHSTLHLLGYDHERSKEAEEEQCRAQREIKEAIEI